jgi:hypothetical protein
LLHQILHAHLILNILWSLVAVAVVVLLLAEAAVLAVAVVADIELQL